MVNGTAKKLMTAAKTLSNRVGGMEFGDPVSHVYNPLSYAWKSHCAYLRFADGPMRVVFLGMNPGPWGMAQTGVPFGEVAAVRDWMGIREKVGKPMSEHPKRLVEGFDCSRSEVSGRRFWGLFAERFGTPDRFFREHFVLNYCPLVFMESSSRNRTPDKLPSEERKQLDAACDTHLRRVLNLLEPEHMVGVGVYAEKCLKRVAPGLTFQGSCHRILHPSPASPAANRDWAASAERQLRDAGVWDA